MGGGHNAILLHPSAPGAFSYTGSGQLLCPISTVVVNSTSTTALTLTGSGAITVQTQNVKARQVRRVQFLR